MDLCRYKDIFGIPGKGVHSYRIFDIAVVDVILTFIFAYFVSYLFSLKYLTALIFSFLLGIGLHWLFCVNTTVGKKLFGVL